MDIENAKRAAAERAVAFIEDGMLVGLGTGSTAKFAIELIGQKVANGLKIQGVPTSTNTEKLARQNNIPLLLDFETIDITIDGADEVAENGTLIKGGGGALTREKIVAAASREVVIIVDENKLVDQLGMFPLPVEVLPFGWRFAAKQLRMLGCKVGLRQSGEKISTTDNLNYILDCRFEKIVESTLLAKDINAIPGVVENGLFVNLANVVVVGKMDGTTQEIRFVRQK
jgi:ribose 5-phosphate isomerase A